MVSSAVNSDITDLTNTRLTNQKFCGKMRTERESLR